MCVCVRGGGGGIKIFILKFAKNTTFYPKINQDKLNTDKLAKTGYVLKTWLSLLRLPSFINKSQNQYFPTDNVPALEADASLLEKV